MYFFKNYAFTFVGLKDNFFCQFLKTKQKKTLSVRKSI